MQFHDATLGDYSYVERQGDVIYADIGKFCAIAPDVRINALAHPVERVSQHKFTYRPNEYFAHAKLDKTFRAKRLEATVHIGHDVWIGHGAIILAGVSIGHGAVIGAGAVVTADVASYAVMAGVPARFLRWRFPPEVAARLLALAWWDWSHEQLGERVPDMQSLSAEAFLDKYEGLR